jgi:hypothetical protein
MRVCKDGSDFGVSAAVFAASDTTAVETTVLFPEIVLALVASTGPLPASVAVFGGAAGTCAGVSEANNMRNPRMSGTRLIGGKTLDDPEGFTTFRSLRNTKASLMLAYGIT